MRLATELLEMPFEHLRRHLTALPDLRKIAAVLGANTVTFNGKRVYGMIALLDAVLLNLVYANRL